ncbi:UDP-glucosyltransferase 2-like isoform X1 [Anopheles funestus]|uniref:UDP-glucosyltransferase 2-like isoform X1 n=2 Tax=Anopheles funestus TaxID=62324 RepID=UPI0020C6C0F9|nr:UDP-glucosyltransferase 2-like isoform X1 [Anopheles funestus]
MVSLCCRTKRMTGSWKILPLLTVLQFFAPNDGYRILGLFPHPGLSHFKVFHPIMRGLANNGHHVTVVSYFPDPNPVSNYHDLRFEGQEILTDAFSLEAFTGRNFFDNFKEFYELVAWGMSSCEAALNSSAIDEILESHRKDPFDLVVMEFFATDCMAGINWLLQVPLVGLSSCALMPWHYDRVGLPDTPSYIPSEFSMFSEEMSFLERVENWLVTRLVKHLYRIVQINDNMLLKAKFPNSAIPDVREIVSNTSLILVNQHYTLSGARPLIPSVIEIGGVHIQSTKPLPTELQQIMNDAPNGVIVVSFGSVLKAATLPAKKRTAMIKAFQHFNQRVVWKWEEPMENQPAHVFTQKWLPQKDVLCHKNVRLFVSHGGLLGVSEAVHCGVPVVIMPIYGDQFLNAAALVNRGVGVRMAYEHVHNVTYIVDCIRKGLNDKKKLNAQALAKAFNNRAQQPLDLARRSIINVIQNGAMAYERSYGAKLPWHIYYSLDVIIMLMIVGVVILFPVSYCCCKVCCGKHVKSKDSHRQRKVNKQKRS